MHVWWENHTGQYISIPSDQNYWQGIDIWIYMILYDIFSPLYHSYSVNLSSFFIYIPSLTTTNYRIYALVMHSVIGIDTGLPPVRRRATIQPNDSYNDFMSVKFQSRNVSHIWNLMRKLPLEYSHLPNTVHFVSGSDQCCMKANYIKIYYSVYPTSVQSDINLNFAVRPRQYIFK